MLCSDWSILTFEQLAPQELSHSSGILSHGHDVVIHTQSPSAREDGLCHTGS